MGQRDEFRVQKERRSGRETLSVENGCVSYAGTVYNRTSVFILFIGKILDTLFSM